MSRRAAPAHGTPAHVEQLQKGSASSSKLRSRRISPTVRRRRVLKRRRTRPPLTSFRPRKSRPPRSASTLTWKPIGFMNNAHYDQLMKTNALDDNLARRIEAYRNVASAEKA